MNIHSHYENLKVSRNAPAEVIRAAYKALSQRYHPDRNPGDSEAARIMTLLNQAYETLSDPAKRREFDAWLQEEERKWTEAHSYTFEELQELHRQDPESDLFSHPANRKRSFEVDWAIVAEVQRQQRRKHRVLSKDSLFAMAKVAAAIAVFCMLAPHITF